MVVDRQQGALKKMKEAGLKRDPLVIYNLLDLTYVFGKRGVWPAESVTQVEREIQEHQFF